MKKLLALTVLLVVGGKILAQQASLIHDETSKTITKDVDTLAWNWKRGGLINLNLAQGSLSNWAAGGDNFSLSIGSYLNYFAYYQNGRNSWDNNLNFNFGYIQTTSAGARKNDDRLDVLSKYGYKLESKPKSKWYLTGLFNFRTQLFDGYTYSSSVPQFSSTLFSPAYVVLSAGMDYKPDQHFSMFISPSTARLVVVANKILYLEGMYGVDSGKHSVMQFGAFATFNYSNTFAKTFVYTGRVDLFSDYLHNPQNVSFYMTNQLAFKIAKYFAVTYSLELIYDDAVKLFGPNGTSPALQVKSLLGIGYMHPLNTRRMVVVHKAE